MRATRLQFARRKRFLRNRLVGARLVREPGYPPYFEFAQRLPNGKLWIWRTPA